MGPPPHLRKAKGSQASSSISGGEANASKMAKRPFNDSDDKDSASSVKSSGSLSQASIPGLDGNRDPVDPKLGRGPPVLRVDIRNITDAIGAMGISVAQDESIPKLPERPAKLNQTGRPINIKLNSYAVNKLPTRPIYQYDVLIPTARESRGLIKKVWLSSQVQSKLKGWLFDGNKLAWSIQNLPGEQRIEVDLSKEKDKEMAKGPSREDKHIIIIRATKTVSLTTLQGYLDKRCSFDETCLEAISFLDHLMRETPSQKFVTIKRSFFHSSNQKRFFLGEGVEAQKGVYAAMHVSSINNRAQLSVNVDVANGTFWKRQSMEDAIVALCRLKSEYDIAMTFKNARSKGWDQSPFKRDLRRFNRLHVFAVHRGRKDRYCIDKFLCKDPFDDKFEKITKNENGDVVKKEILTMAQYFSKAYHINLKKDQPVVQMTKKSVHMPLEVLQISENERYTPKLDERQTSNMIKFAVTVPKDRWAAVEAGKEMLNWSQDIYHKNYGLVINDKPIEVQGRVLQCPDVAFANGAVQAREASQGRWRIDGRKFIAPNRVGLKSWAIAILQVRGRSAVDAPGAKRFAQELVRIYRLHGGQVANAVPHLAVIPCSGDGIAEIWNATGNKFNLRPELLVFIVPDRNTDNYLKIKKSCDCRFGVASQVLQSAHVMKCQAQYISNVCMKINAKLRGATARASGMFQKNPNAKLRTMIIGADVSHPPPGSEGGSYAAITMSTDKECMRYAATVRTNGRRVEIINTDNIDRMVLPLARHWMSNVGEGRFPDRIIYFRDGVAEGQYAHVLQREVRDIRQIIHSINLKGKFPPMTVVIASKRHHVRFFPTQGGDRNGNAPPGTLVETGVTHPFQFDFYLSAHSAIKGTARPVHYQVILNEAKMGPEELQQMIFEHSFQYMRSTTPVSIIPAIYYAHLASNRAKAHDRVATPSSGKKQTEEKKQTTETSSGSGLPEVDSLLSILETPQHLETSMWYI